MPRTSSDAAAGNECSGASSVASTAGPGDRHPVGGRGLQRVADVQVVGERLRPVLPRVHRRVGRDEALRPVGRRARARSGGPSRPGSRRARRRTARGSARAGRAVGAEDRLVVVRDLVAHVAEQRAVGLLQLLAHPARWASSASARSSVMRPSAWPVVTSSCSLLSRSKARPPGCWLAPATGRPSSSSSKSSRRLASSALAKRSTPSASPLAGRVRVSAQLKQSSPGAPARPLQAIELAVGARRAVAERAHRRGRPSRSRAASASAGTRGSRRPRGGRSPGR